MSSDGYPGAQYPVPVANYYTHAGGGGGRRSSLDIDIPELTSLYPAYVNCLHGYLHSDDIYRFSDCCVEYFLISLEKHFILQRKLSHTEV